MAERATRGEWVEIRSVVLAPEQRAPGVPDDTRRVPLELRVKGVLQADAALGEEVEVVTAIGRRLGGTLIDIRPAYAHGFGPPVDALRHVGPVARELLASMRGDTGEPRA